MPPTLDNFLNADDGAGKLMAHARLLTRLARVYAEMAPPHLYEASLLANYRSGIIIIHALNGAVAAKLRQMAPTLAEGFSRRGVECNGVQIKVQGTDFPEQSRSSTQKPLSAQTSRTLTALRDTLSDPALRAAVDTLIQRAAKGE